MQGHATKNGHLTVAVAEAVSMRSANFGNLLGGFLREECLLHGLDL